MLPAHSQALGDMMGAPERIFEVGFHAISFLSQDSEGTSSGTRIVTLDFPRGALTSMP